MRSGRYALHCNRRRRVLQRIRNVPPQADCCSHRVPRRNRPGLGAAKDASHSTTFEQNANASSAWNAATDK